MKKQDNSKKMLFEMMHKVTGMPLNEDVTSNNQQNDSDNVDIFSRIEPKEKRMLLRFINQLTYEVPKMEMNDFIGMIIEFEDPENLMDDLKLALDKFNNKIKPLKKPYWTDRLFDLLSRNRDLLSKYDIADSFMQLYYDDVEYEMGYPDYNFNSL